MGKKSGEGGWIASPVLSLLSAFFNLMAYYEGTFDSIAALHRNYRQGHVHMGRSLAVE
jgi:hypothetical protein